MRTRGAQHTVLRGRETIDTLQLLSLKHLPRADFNPCLLPEPFL